jgi:hypothetical protein
MMEEKNGTACVVTPKYNREYAKAHMWTLAIPVDLNNRAKVMRGIFKNQQI